MHDVHARDVPSTATTTPDTEPAATGNSGMALDAVLASHPTPSAVAQVVARFPNDRGALIARLQKTLGNRFVHDVIAQLPKTPNMAEIDRQLGIAKRQERRGGVAFEVITHYGEDPKQQELKQAREDIAEAQEDFSDASIDLDDQDERLRDMLAVQGAMPTEMIVDSIVVFHEQDREYKRAKRSYDDAVASLIKVMGYAEKTVEDKGGTSEESIVNYGMLAVASIEGAVTAGLWLNTKATIDPKSHKVTVIDPAYQKNTAQLDGLLTTIISAIASDVTGKVRARMATEKSPKAQWEAAWEALDENVIERVEQIEHAVGLREFKAKLKAAIESTKFLDAAGKPTPELLQAIKSLEVEVKELGPISKQIITGCKAMFTIAVSGVNTLVGDMNKVIESGGEVAEAARTLDKLWHQQPTGEKAEELERMKAIANLEHKGRVLHRAIIGLGLVGDGFSFVDDLHDLERDNHDPFRYSAIIGDFIGTMGDALMLLPPPGDAVGVAISVLGHGITSVSQLAAMVWESFEGPQVEKDRRKVFPKVRPDKDKQVDNDALTSVSAEANIGELEQAKLSKDQIELIVHDCPDVIKAEGAVYLLLKTRYRMLTTGLAVLSHDVDGQAGWRTYTLNDKSPFDFVHDAGHHFGGNITGFATSYADKPDDGGWLRIAAIQWIGPTITQTGEGDGIYSIGDYTVGGEVKVKG